MCRDGVFAPIAVIIEQLLVCFDVSGSHQDQVRRPIDGVEPRLTVSTFTVVQQPSKAARFLRSIDALMHKENTVTIHSKDQNLFKHIKQL